MLPCGPGRSKCGICKGSQSLQQALSHRAPPTVSLQSELERLRKQAAERQAQQSAQMARHRAAAHSGSACGAAWFPDAGTAADYMPQPPAAQSGSGSSTAGARAPKVAPEMTEALLRTLKVCFSRHLHAFAATALQLAYSYLREPPVTAKGLLIDATT